MGLADHITEASSNHPGKTFGTIVGLTLLLALLAALPSLWPGAFPWLNPVRVDTDPENMLRQDEPARVFHNRMKETFNLHDMIVVGVVNEQHPQGVFNPDTLARVHELTEFAKGLTGENVGAEQPNEGVVRADIIAPSTVDNIEQAGLGTVRFEWLMAKPPQTVEQAEEIRANAERIPFLDGTLVSEDGKALAIYLPITSKKLSFEVWSKLNDKIETFQGQEQWHITGLPVANDVFGVEMFKQMAISAPLAMLVIFLLMLVFFRKLVLIVSPLLVALVSVIVTMSLLVVTGNTIHIMSSMIPIFIMPIAVLDSIHILSEFFDRYQASRNRVQTIEETIRTLFLPMLYTSITSAAGFASLALTPIPPVQVFGIFVAFGILAAWILTITLIPAYVMFIPEGRLENFGAAHTDDEQDGSLITRLLQAVGRSTYRRSKAYLGLTVLLIGVAAYGISLIQINDNPTKWFKKDHPIRLADRVLNEHFGGTYMAYLTLKPADPLPGPKEYVDGFVQRLDTFVSQQAMEAKTPELQPRVIEKARAMAGDVDSKAALLKHLEQWIDAQAQAADSETAYAWEELLLFLDQEAQRDDVFKDPDVLKYIAELQKMLGQTGQVGKSNAVTDIVKTVHRELMGGSQEAFSIPDSSRAVAQTLVTYQSSHRPQDLWHFVTPDYRRATLWVQLKSGDNKDMSAVVQAVDRYMQANQAPVKLEKDWFGLTYINVIWQDKMVSGMLKAFLGSFLVVLLMMILLFRSAIWAVLSMVPLTVTVALIYGIIGLVGKDYDMPVAVLSSLTIGLAVDFAIHFLVRSRVLQEGAGSWHDTVPRVFSEPARAILRNVIVIALGFTPLLAAPLVPYITVGTLMASILLLSGGITLLILPALMRHLERLLFPETDRISVMCKCGTCAVAGIAAVALIIVNIMQFVHWGWTGWTVISLAALPVFFGLCAAMSRRARCRTDGSGQAAA